MRLPEPQLSDGSVRVRAVAERDLDALVAACQDPEIARWTTVPSPYGREDAERFLAASREGFETGGHVVGVVSAVDTDALLGTIGISIQRHDLVGDLGYWVAAGARGRGVATAAARLLCRWAFDTVDLGRLQLRAAVANEASNRVARACGFRLEGLARHGGISGHTGSPADPRIDLNLYGLLPDELT